MKDEKLEWTGNYVQREINGYNLLVSSGNCPDRKWTYELNDTAKEILNFIQTRDNVSFPELILYLNKRYGVTINDSQEKAINLVISEFIKMGVINGIYSSEGSDTQDNKEK